MLDIRLEVDCVDYDKSVEALIPALGDWSRRHEKLRDLDRFLEKLGPDAVPAARKLLGYLGEDTKDAVIVWLITVYREKLRATLNRYMERLFPGGAVRIRGLYAQDQPGSRMTLLASRVEMDYQLMLKSPLVEEGVERLGKESGLLKGAARLAVQMGARMSQENLEKQGVALLGSDRVKAKLLSALSEGLRQEGLYVRFRDLELESGDTIYLPDAMPGQEEGEIPPALREALLDALAAWVRDGLR